MDKKSIIEKIWDAHVVVQKQGHPAILAIDMILLHEVTSAQGFLTLEEKGLEVFDPGRCLGTIDHSIPTRPNRHEIFDEAAKKQVQTHRDNCQRHGIPFWDFDSGKQGVVHVVAPEQGISQPGMTMVCGDSHTSTHGAFGALAFGVGSSEVGYVLATGCLLQQQPKTMRVEFKGQFKRGVNAKDAVLKLIAEIGVGGANGHVIEYCGEAVKAMTMEERMTLCNMSIECGARAGLVAPDEKTFEYLKGRAFAPKDEDWRRAVDHWSAILSDAGCSYDKELSIDVSALPPMVTWGTNPSHAISIDEEVPHLSDLPEDSRVVAQKALEYADLKEGQAICGTEIQWAFLGSCTNGRIEDLRIAADILKGRKVSEKVTMYVVPGSEVVMEQAKAEGLDKVFEEAGADFRMPGCSMCLAMNDDVVPAGERCVSSTNRNFVGRQGPGSRTHLASPATVAASAIEGCIASAEKYFS